MKFKFLFSLPLLGCLAFASCYPIPDKPKELRPRKKDVTVTSQDQQKIQEQRDLMKENEAKEKEAADIAIEGNLDTPTPTPPTPPSPPSPPKKTVEERVDYAFANPVPGKEGFVFSPYNNKEVDVRDIPSGTLVADPTYPATEKKYFRVP